MGWHVRVIRNRYADSVRLMAIARDVRAKPGVARCELGMGTPANLELLAGLKATAEATPADLVVAVEGDEDAAREALASVERALSQAGTGAGSERTRERPRSLALAASEMASGANLALISVPGEYATLEAHRALSRGMHVFLFSDHVPLEAEVELKRRAVDRGLLVMGPECGTAMLGGVGLGFANAVRPGRVGIVAAAGTGAQESACLLDAVGAGVSHIIGVGGRDLSEAVGGLMFIQAMRLLADDPQTDTLLLVSKSPTAAGVRALGSALPTSKRVVASFVGWQGESAPLEVHATLEAGALAAAGARPVDLRPLEAQLDARRIPGHLLLGLYSGGSLAHEAATLLEPELGPLAGNVGGGPRLDTAEVLAGRLLDTPPSGDGTHVLLDLGEAEYTRGRPHPMVDPEPRAELLARVAEHQHLGCVLLDVVLGYASHPDPARVLAPAVARAAGHAVVIARVCGTRDDPQDLRRQERTLRRAGAILAPSNAAAARLALRALRAGGDRSRCRDSG